MFMSKNCINEKITKIESFINFFKGYYQHISKIEENESFKLPYLTLYLTLIESICGWLFPAENNFNKFSSIIRASKSEYSNYYSFYYIQTKITPYYQFKILVMEYLERKAEQFKLEANGKFTEFNNHIIKEKFNEIRKEKNCQDADLNEIRELKDYILQNYINPARQKTNYRFSEPSALIEAKDSLLDVEIKSLNKDFLLLLKGNLSKKHKQILNEGNYINILWSIRNNLVHTSLQQDNNYWSKEEPYYFERKPSYELVIPFQFIKSLCQSVIENLDNIIHDLNLEKTKLLIFPHD